MASKRARKTAHKPHRASGDEHNYGQRLLGDALSVANALVRSQKSFGAQKLESFAEATREYAQSLGDIPAAQSYVNLASESVDALADYVADTDLDEMISDAIAFARHQPMATVLVALSIGLMATVAVRTQGVSYARSVRRPSPARSRSKSARRSSVGKSRRVTSHANGADKSEAHA